ncbi:hypothetical protein [Dyadobacter sandarakinus]|uniref:ZU5 domain-containing protein n=1 Tax=Dyadobacter sandarakinus TaxID=2747268 RepID=A0ABX7I5J8_9BACT|nr:hypothetical protein [Dyadobacter sandarakinus]QRR01376.1 hypothetical protein HWI92_10920 [Dyadobacter sandarakinus]
MKILHYLHLTILAIFLITSCKEPDRAPDSPGTAIPGATEPGGYAAEVGLPDGAVIEKLIGPEGGVIEDSTGRFRIEVPAGALTTPVTIGLQPITNTNMHGVGTAYRLTPHGQTFQKPVKLSVHYDENDLTGTMPGALGIAYQNQENTWMAVGGAKLDTTQRTLSVRSTHFSDWDLFESMRMVPLTKAIDPGAKVEVSVRRWKSGPGDDLAPLIPESQELAMMQATEPLDPKYITGWQLTGEGSLQASGNAGVYQAPDHIPARNPAEVLVKLRSNGKEVGFAISKIYVAPKGISIQVADGAWRTIGNGGMNGLAGFNMINASQDGHAVSLHWRGPRAGTFKWTFETVICTYTINGKQTYYHLYGMRPDVSKGGLTVAMAGNGEGGEMAVGHFSVPSAGLVDATNPQDPRYTTTSMRGIFRVELY